MAFDLEYYQRFYFDRRTAVTSKAEMRARARLIAGCADYIGLPVSKILDAGCGVGMLRAPLLRGFRRASYTGLEFSEYLCRRYGWSQGSIETFRTRERFDLVICYDVLQYLDDAAASRAIANLAKLTSAALYISALTREDWRENCDRSLTDGSVHLRPGEWYRRRLRRRFNYLGFGVWLRKDVTAILWDMERP